MHPMHIYLFNLFATQLFGFITSFIAVLQRLLILSQFYQNHIG